MQWIRLLTNCNENMEGIVAISRTVTIQMIHPTRTLLTAAFSLLSAITAQAGPTPITAPKVITEPGSYVLANDITGTTAGNVIEIQASDVTLNLNGHTITATVATGISIDEFVGNNTGNATLVNAHVSNGKVVAAGLGVQISGSSCLINGLNITSGPSGTSIEIEHGNLNRVQSCVLSAATGQTAGSAVGLFLTSHNTIQNNTFAGIYVITIEELDQAGTHLTVVGDNTFSGNHFASPTP